MKRYLLPVLFLLLVIPTCFSQAAIKWKIHDMNRPVPPIITPGTFSTQDTPGNPPSDAVVLFDGKDLSHWVDKDGKEAKWKVENGFMQVAPNTGAISTKDSFGDCQLHVEFSEPLPATGESQERGNSGVFLMSQFEVQVLDSYENRTYADGQVSAIYGQYPPQVNAARPPGTWQTYDIVFHAPRFSKAGKLERPARITILHNGVLTQDNVELTGPTAHGSRPPYKAGPDRMPIQLQDHEFPVRFRNIWIRELKEPA